MKNKFETRQLAHAYLFSGQDLESIRNFAKRFSKLVNCLYYKSNGREICSIDEKRKVCQNCRMAERGNYLDFMIVKSANSESSLENGRDMMNIEIEQIRQAQDFLALKPYYGNYKFLIVDDAERMTFQAQSCFLKTLEEPRGKTIIFLISSKPSMLLPTVSSRCQEIKFFYQGTYEILNEEQELFSDLKKIMGLELAEKFQYAKNADLQDQNFSKILGVLRKYFRQLLLFKIGVISEPPLSFSAKSYTAHQVKKIIELIENISHQATQNNINNKMALEVILMEI